MDKERGNKIGLFCLKQATVIVTLLAVLFFSVYTGGSFASYGNVVNILRSMSITTILAIAFTVTLACDGFDMSTCTLASCAGYVFMACYLWYGLPLWLSIVICIVFTMTAYLLTMFLILVCKIPDMLATCALMFIHQGIGQWFTGGGGISAGMNLPDGTIPKGLHLRRHLQNWADTLDYPDYASVHCRGAYIFTAYKAGAFLYAIGSNKKAAELSGISVAKYRFLAGMVTAVFIGIGAVVVCSRNTAAQLGGCDNYLMTALAAVFVGRSVGGKEKPFILGTTLGAALIVILENGLILCSVPYYVLPAVKGFVLASALAAVYIKKKE